MGEYYNGLGSIFAYHNDFFHYKVPYLARDGEGNLEMGTL